MADEALTAETADEASTSQPGTQDVSQVIDSSDPVQRFLRLKKSQRRRYNWLRRMGHSAIISLELCKSPIKEGPILAEEVKQIKRKLKNERKQKQNAPVDTTGAIIVGILPVEYPVKLFTPEQQKIIEATLAAQIIHCTGPPPRFYKMSHRPSYLVFYCVDQSTADWVKEQEGLLHLPEINVVVRPEKEFPSMRLVMGRFPYSKPFCSASITKMISSQNNIPAYTWKALTGGSDITAKSSKLIFSIDEASFNALEQKKFVVSYLLGQVKLRLVKSKINVNEPTLPLSTNTQGPDKEDGIEDSITGMYEGIYFLDSDSQSNSSITSSMMDYCL